MTDKTIKIVRKVGSDWFKLIYSRRSIYKLSHFLNFNPNNYWIYKATNYQRLVSYEDVLEFKYACYMFFKKDLYDKEHIDKWIKYINELGGIQYLVKPFPPFDPEEKIIIR